MGVPLLPRVALAGPVRAGLDGPFRILRVAGVAFWGSVVAQPFSSAVLQTREARLAESTRTSLRSSNKTDRELFPLEKDLRHRALSWAQIAAL